jgi:hypothetical protein
METFKAKIHIAMPSEESFRSAIESADAGVSGPLRDLCHKEVTLFEEYLQRADPSFQEGLVHIERLAITGYLYQKLRGHIDAQEVKGLPGKDCRSPAGSDCGP